MKKIVKFGLFLLLVTIPGKVMGYCTTEDKLRYSTLASNITTSYDYVEVDESVSFNITIHNVHRDLIVLDKQTGLRYNSKQNDLNNFTIRNLKDGTSYVFEIYADNSDCSYRLYNTLYVTVPKYNKYYKYPACNGASNYLYCQKWVETGDLTYTELVKLVEEYKDSISDETITPIEEKKDWWQIIGDFWAKYYLFIAGGIILVCVTIIIIKNKRDTLDF